jgi:hypothetical protein
LNPQQEHERSGHASKSRVFASGTRVFASEHSRDRRFQDENFLLTIHSFFRLKITGA